ncbi:hypothetical protein HMI54_002779 [Coelomomyces lativittatus]|nr:hypothetical protein HMI55_003301 [Coelomomyces lativittatus]KAJ1508950.1 hypothetical protein HMI54_002779 [Coelomomyces lativittatus]KAJ1512210.1 hypothetical protein HMI56_004361 [Coelomomyces lativittatus]
MKLYRHATEFEHNWGAVTFAVFNKYPNPFASHVLKSDILSRQVVPDSGVLQTTRIHLKSGIVPKWGQTFFNQEKAHAFIIEDSMVDIKTKTMVTRTRNLDHRRILYVEEVQRISQHPTNPNWTQMTTTARITSDIGWGLTSKLEKFGLKRFAENMAKSRQGLLHVLSTLRYHISP